MAIKLKCPVCGNEGTLMQKTTKAKGYTYRKWYIYHNRSKGTKQRWCYLSKEYLELPEIKEAIEQLTTQTATQNNPITTQRTNKLNLGSFNQKRLVIKVCYPPFLNETFASDK